MLCFIMFCLGSFYLTCLLFIYYSFRFCVFIAGVLICVSPTLFLYFFVCLFLSVCFVLFLLGFLLVLFCLLFCFFWGGLVFGFLVLWFFFKAETLSHKNKTKKSNWQIRFSIDSFCLFHCHEINFSLQTCSLSWFGFYHCNKLHGKKRTIRGGKDALDSLQFITKGT